MKDTINLKTMKPFRAEGHVCLELKDPRSGKVKEQVKGKNMVFPDSLFSTSSAIQGDSNSWPALVSLAHLWMNDDDTAASADFPFVRGQTIGYGVPSTAGLGAYRGAYNETNQVLAEVSTEKMRWKFQYDFTTAQANGTIKNVGLTYQSRSASSYVGNFPRPLSGFSPKSVPRVDTSNCYWSGSDSRYLFMINAATGIITKWDQWLGTSTTIDVSATVGTTSAEYKHIGYAPATGKYYICRYSSTTSNRKMWVFSDSTFTTLENTYSMSNITAANSSSQMPFYVYGDYAYFCTSTTNRFYKTNFVSNIAHTNLDIPITRNNAIYTQNITPTATYMMRGSVAFSGRYIYFGGAATASRGIVYDLATETIVAYIVCGDTINGYYTPPANYPISENTFPCMTWSYMDGSTYPIGFFHANALTTYVLPTPVVKTTEFGLTVTYELEVFWDAA